MRGLGSRPQRIQRRLRDVELNPTHALNKKASIIAMLAFFSACSIQLSPVKAKKPQIEGANLDCSRETDSWTARAFADAWTHGGEVVLSTPDRIEIHNLESIRAAPFDEGDELLLNLLIVADPDQAQSGSKTGFLCNEAQTESLSVRLSLLDFETETESDCWRWGPEFDFSPWGYSPCGRVEIETTFESALESTRESTVSARAN